MNRQEWDILNIILEEGYTNQRTLAELSNYSLGTVNSALRTLIEMQYLNDELDIKDKALLEIKNKKPKNAIILAAGYGIRMVPINKEIPKGLLRVHGELLIERLIMQLQEADIYDIDIVVGFMKEKYEYLIDKFRVNLIYNPEYALKNNIHSLGLLVQKISNTYIIPCDVWSGRNLFSKNELYSWYSVSDIVDDESTVRVNRKNELVYVNDDKAGNQMIGISYILEEQANQVRDKLTRYCADKKYNKSFWEDVLFDGLNKMIVYAKVVSANDVYEINTYEQLRELDEKSENLDSKIINLISNVLDVRKNDIQNIKVLKKGMTNRSFYFECYNKQYIMRVPGEGTDKLINRKNEYDVYKELLGSNIADNVIYISEDTGFKITEYWDDARVCDPLDLNDVNMCMQRLRDFHNNKLTVQHVFDIFERIEFYESLWEDKPSIFDDYKETKKKVYELKAVIERLPKDWSLTHIDAVPDNFLFLGDEIRLIDWEYAGMQDPHVDIAMFAIYSMYDRAHIDLIIDNYFMEGCIPINRMKIYCYIAVCGLLWSNWCEFKRHCGIEFGEYSLKQYRYAKEYYSIVINEYSELLKETNYEK